MENNIHTIRLVNFQERDFNVQSSIKVTDKVLSNMLISIRPIVQYRMNSDLVGIQIRVGYEYEKQELLNYGVLLTFRVQGWKELVKGINADKHPVEHAKQLFEIAMGFLRGAMAVYARNTVFADTFLPLIDIKEMMSTVCWEEIPADKP